MFPFSPPVYLWNMKYIIKENRLIEIFNSYMDSLYGLKYNGKTREFMGNNGEVFGYLMNGHFFYGNYTTEYLLNQLFGELTNELLLHYLIKRFPDISIDDIE